MIECSKLHTSKNMNALKMLEHLSFSKALLTSGCMPQIRPCSFLFCLNNRPGQECPTFRMKNLILTCNIYQYTNFIAIH